MGWIIAGVLIISAIVVSELIMHIVLVPRIASHFERMPNFKVEPGKPDDEAVSIGFATSDGLNLQGCHYHHQDEAPRGVIVFCHELKGNRWTAMSYCQALWQAGFDVVAFDFRNHGDSDHQPGYQPLHWATDYEIEDVLSCIRYVKDAPELRHLPIGLFGVSRGGTAAMVAAERVRDIECLVCDSAFSVDGLMVHHAKRWAELFVSQSILKLVPDWHIRRTLRLVRNYSQKRRGVPYADVERDIHLLRDRSILFVTGGSDTYVPSTVAESLRQQIGSGEVWNVPKAKHNKPREVSTAEYDRRIVSLVEKIAVPVAR
ncbi:MAG: alpha/beta fold hydrolase [Planctomycetota bacterium]|nr:alpha/beta fold hydrolase [Planctomycetota bacterium]